MTLKIFLASMSIIIGISWMIVIYEMWRAKNEEDEQSN